MTTRTIIDISRENRSIDAAAPRLIRTALLVGILGIAASIGFAARGDGNLTRFYSAYLTSFVFFLSISLGALFFVLLQHVTGSGWSVVVRRIAEAIAANIPYLAVLAIPILIGMRHLFIWTDPSHLAEDPILAGKRPYLNIPFFVIRMVVYFAAWTWLALWYRRRSITQDRTGDPRVTLAMQRWSAPGIVLYAFTVTICSFDLLMSLAPDWFSTIFPVYFFSGGVVGYFALLPIVTILLQRSGRLSHTITGEHYHDMGKLVFAFLIFWAYIAFSQYMLIWVGNLPEETSWFLRRQTGGWTPVSLLLVFGHFFAPFFLLLPRTVKRRRRFLLLPALWVLAMHWVDVYWLVMPQALHGQAGPALRPVDITCLIGIGGLYVAGMVHRMRGHSLVPERDPRLADSLSFENA